MSFISALIPSKLWVHTYLEQPFVEGIERIRRTIHGKYLHQLQPNHHPIFGKDRALYLLSGVVLLVPLVNTIIWIFMQTFGGAEPLPMRIPRQ
jgi:hypothetical protein